MKLTTVFRSLAPLFLAAATALAFAVTLAAAGEPTQQLKAGINSVLDILRDSQLKGEDKKAERRSKLIRAISKRFDFEDMARRSLARHWKKRNSKERQEFVTLFSGILGKSYINKIESYTDEKIEYLKENIDDIYARVNTVIVTKRKQEIPISYRMHKVDSNWMVYDVIIEGVSLVNTYRQQFRSFLRKSSYEVLVKKLRERQAEG